MRACILAGGFGTRLRTVVSDVPKPLAMVDGRPFLEYLIDYLKGFDVVDLVLSIGYKSDLIRAHFGDGSAFGVHISYAVEETSLGTAGGIKLAGPQLGTSPFLVLNGDSYCPVDLGKLIQFHREKNSIVSISLIENEDTTDCGNVILDSKGAISRFAEKKVVAGAYANAGVYLFSPQILDLIPEGIKYSLETDLFPRLVGHGLYGVVSRATLFDIGTPERFERVQRFFSSTSFVDGQSE